MSTALQLPHWDMTVVYPSLDSPEFDSAFRAAVQSLEDLVALFDEYHIDRHPELPLDDDSVRAFETVLGRLSSVTEEMALVLKYAYCFVTTDSRDDLAQARLSELQQHMVTLSQLETRLTAWLGSLDVEELIRRSAVAQEYAFPVRRAKDQAVHLMSPPEEGLAAELGLTGGTAWGKLHGNLTSQMLVRIERDGGSEEVPMSVVRNMAFDPDRDVRRRAYEAEIEAWKRNALPLAAALNSIKGETNALNRHRKWQSPLDGALFSNVIDRPTLEAMLGAARASFPDFRRYLRTKARALGLEALAWYDLFAPVGQTTQEWDYEKGVDFLLEQFGTYSDRLRAFADRAFRERWVDAEPRPGKRDGAFCLSLRNEESRVLANYRPTYDGMSTLAHELGHGYHNFNLARRPLLLRDTPMTLAETASIFCETIVREAALAQANAAEQIAILEASVQGACQVTVDITSRFMFESGALVARRQRELSVEELNELMLDAQRQTYGEGVDNATLHPYMWAVKSHYYSVDRPFYNYPYMFGLLFGLGLYAIYRRDPESFRAAYDDLLSSTGMADPATLAHRFGINIRERDFWESSLDVVRADIDRLEALLDSSRTYPSGNSA